MLKVNKKKYESDINNVFIATFEHVLHQEFLLLTSC